MSEDFVYIKNEINQLRNEVEHLSNENIELKSKLYAQSVENTYLKESLSTMETRLLNKDIELNTKMDVHKQELMHMMDRFDVSLRGNGKIGILEEMRRQNGALGRHVLYFRVYLLLFGLLFGIRVWDTGLDEIIRYNVNAIKPKVQIVSPYDEGKIPSVIEETTKDEFNE